MSEPGESLRPAPSDVFRRLAYGASNKLGSHWAFIAAVSLVVGWVVSGPFFRFNDHWQLVINTGTTIITFLMVFLIQSTQNRDAKAIHLKLDELIRSSKARNTFADLEDATEEELDKLQREFEQLRLRGKRGGAAAIEEDDRVAPGHEADAEEPDEAEALSGGAGTAAARPSPSPPGR